MSERMPEYIQAKDLIRDHQYPAALDIVMGILDEDPNDAQALFLLGSICIHQEKRGLAYNIYARAAKLAEDSPEVWAQYGRCQGDDPAGWEASEWCFQKALDLDPQNIYAHANMASLEIGRNRPEEGLIWARKCLAIKPDYEVAKSAVGFASLMLGDWKTGWENFDCMLGHRSRPDIAYGNLPIWDGTPGKTVIVYGEQGIGDEILFASVLPDMAKDCRVIYDTMPRLKSLMARSFEDIENIHVIGGRWDSSVTLPEGWIADARISQAGIMRYYRQKDADFPGTPYLRAHEGMRIQMRALLDSLGTGKPRIGIAWTGGTKHSRQQFRNTRIEDYLPLLTEDAIWVSLQYRSPAEELEALRRDHGVTVHHFDWITEAKEYDYTAALVAELDLVITVPTSVSQLSGGLGKEAFVLVPEITGWIFAHEPFVWAKSVRLFRDKPIKTVREYLDKWQSATTTNSVRQLRAG